MLANLPVPFVEKLDASVRAPIQLLEFHFSTEVLYVSDQTFKNNPNFTNTYLPYVEDWGTLVDNIDVEPILKQSSIETRQLTITLINNQKPPFSWYFNANPPENVKVYLYQLFEGMLESEKVLIDIFICQDPIVISEANITIQLDLVSVIMQRNPFIAGVGSVRDKKFPYVIGKAVDIGGVRIDENPVSTLEYDLPYDHTAEVLLANSIGFAASGTIIIDSEIITYTTWTPGALKVLTRGTNGSIARPHYRGAKVMHYARNYDFALCTGPITSIADVKLDLTDNFNTFEFHTESNPAFIRFLGRMPYFRTEPGETGPPIVYPDTNVTHFGLNYEATSINTTTLPTNPTAINNDTADVGIALSETRPATVPGTDAYSETKQHWGTSTRTYATDSVSGFQSINPSYINQAAGVGSVRGFRDSTNDNVRLGLFSRLYKSQLPSGNITSISYEVKYRIYTSGHYSNPGTKYGMYLVNRSTGATIVKRDRLFTTATPGTGAWSSWHIDSATFSAVDNIDLYDVGALMFLDQTYGTDNRVEIEYVKWYATYYYEGTPSYTPPYTANTQTLEIVAHFNNNLSNLGTLKGVTCRVGYWGSATKTNLAISAVKRVNNDQSSDQVVQLDSTTSTIALKYIDHELYITNWTELASYRFGARFVMSGAIDLNPGQTRSISGGVKYVMWIITYQPLDQATPDEIRFVYGEKVTATVIGLDGFPITPPQAIRNLLDRIGGLDAYIDTTTFDAAHAFYNNIGYYFNGAINQEYKLHDAIKELLRQGFCRLCFNQGVVKLLYYTIDAKPLSKNFIDDDRVLKSTIEERVGLSNIKNSIAIRYNYNISSGYYSDVYLANDAQSIASFGLLEDATELSLINDTDVVTYISALLMWFKANPYAITQFTFFLTAYPIEKMDVITVKTDFNNYIAYAGEVLTVSRSFGSGKNNTINKITVTCRKVAHNAYVENLTEQVVIDDSIDYRKGIIEHIIEQVVIDDSDVVSKLRNEYIKQLIDTVKIVDAMELIETPALLQNLYEEVTITDGNIDYRKGIIENLYEEVTAQDVVVASSAAGYGMGMFGTNPYGK